MTFDNKFLSHLTVGLSISESPDIARFGFGLMHLQDAMVEVSRYLLASGAKLAYAGMIEYRGLNFLDTFFQLAKTHNRENEALAEKLLFYRYGPVDTSTKAGLSDLATLIELDPVEESDDDAGASETQYATARNLTSVREKMSNDIDARIILGGKTHGFLGKYPGLVEEPYLALQANKAVFLMGAFGGCSQAIIEALKGNTPEALTEAYQLSNAKYADFVAFYNKKAETEGFEPIDYGVLVDFFAQKGVDGLNNGLTREENERLFETTRITEMISLILKGLKKIDSGN